MQSCTAVDLACSTGVTISVAQRAALQSSLPLLKKNYKFSEVFLFGKILCKRGMIACQAGDSAATGGSPGKVMEAIRALGHLPFGRRTPVGEAQIAEKTLAMALRKRSKFQSRAVERSSSR